MKWKLCGGTLKLKQGAVPRKFECQKIKRTATVTRPGYEKRQGIDFFETLLTKDVMPSVAQQEIEFISFDNPPVELNELNNPILIDNTLQIELPATEIKKTRDKKIQVEQQKKDLQIQTIKHRKNVEEALSLELNASFDCDKMECTSDSSSDSYTDSIETYEVYTDNHTNTCLKIEHHSKLYLGIPKQSYFVISLLEENTKCPLLHILITLKKIKLNDSYQRLEIDFNTRNI